MALSSLPITSLFASPSLFRRIPKCDVSKGTAWYHRALPGKVAIAAWSTRQSPGWLVRQMLDASEGQYPFWKISKWLQSVSKCAICHHILPKMKITWDYQTDIRSAFFPESLHLCLAKLLFEMLENFKLLECPRCKTLAGVHRWDWIHVTLIGTELRSDGTERWKSNTADGLFEWNCIFKGV